MSKYYKKDTDTIDIDYNSSKIMGTLWVDTKYSIGNLEDLWRCHGHTDMRKPAEYPNPWVDGVGNELTSDDIHNYIGFIYKITNVITNKFYIGKKSFWFKRNKKLRESDWKKYYGSCKPLLEDIKDIGETSFRREVLWLCSNKRDLSFFEVYEQMYHNVLLDDNAYNTNVLGKFFKRKDSTEIIELVQLSVNRDKSKKRKKRSQESFRKAAVSNSDLWDITFPDGHVEYGVRGLRQFCATYGLDASNLFSTQGINKKLNAHRGFSCEKSGVSSTRKPVKYWWNNGKTEVKSTWCPSGYKHGRLPSRKRIHKIHLTKSHR